MIAAETGWTLDAVDAMTLQDYSDWQAYRETLVKLRPAKQEQTVPRRPRRRR